jgi:DNA polymerase I
MVALERFSGQEIRLWMEELTARRSPPFPIGPRDIIVTYAATAEASAFLALGWPNPQTILDLYVEFRMLTNGRQKPPDYKLASALAAYGLPHLFAMEKKALQDRCVQGPPFAPEEVPVILEYCAEDSRALQQLLPCMLPSLDLPQCFLRGRYMWNLAKIQQVGIPMDYAGFQALTDAWTDVKTALIEEYDASYRTFHNGQFSHAHWLQWCEDQGIEWPRTETGRAETKVKTFQSMAKPYPAIAPMAELQATLNQMKAHELIVYPDGRHRPWMNPFGTLTGRNMPPPTKYVFGAPAWLRGYIQAPPGSAVVYLDWSGQEIGIVAALAGDKAMQTMYNTGDPHLAFGQYIGLIPDWVTKERVKETHGRERDICKVLLLGVNYGLSARGFARQAQIPLWQAEAMVAQHRRLFAQYWAWVERVIETAYLRQEIETVFGWRFHNVVRPRKVCGTDAGVNPRTIQDFPAQANGAEIMRLAVCWMVEAGLHVGGVVHDAIVLTAPLAHVNDHITQAQHYMEQAGRKVLGGFRLFSDQSIYPYPQRFLEKKGQRMWDIVQAALGRSVGVGTLGYEE